MIFLYIVTHTPAIHNNSHLCKAGRDAGVWHGLAQRHTEIDNRRPNPGVRIIRLVSKTDLPALLAEKPLHQYMNHPFLFPLFHDGTEWFREIALVGAA